MPSYRLLDPVLPHAKRRGSIPFQNYLWLAAAFTLVQIFTYALFGLYQSFRKTRLLDELFRLWRASLLDMVYC
ncbi:MAG: hypothetical protein ACLSB9_21895 [Hydrogeniiclostridium mannosilyticum]